MTKTYAWSGTICEWYVYIRNCKSDETCCRNWFCVNPKNKDGQLEPENWMNALELMKKNIDVWHEYALVHRDAKYRYDGKPDEHFCCS